VSSKVVQNYVEKPAVSLFFTIIKLFNAWLKVWKLSLWITWCL